MKFFHLPNLRSVSVTCTPLPTDGTPNCPARPQLTGKAAYRKWCESPDTDHVFFSLVEGETPGARVTAVNEPYWIHGLVGEYDAKPGASWKATLADNAEILPTWISETFSGNVRMIWAFSEPAPYRKGWAAEFLKAAWASIKPKKLAPGWDEKESSDLGHYFEMGCNWETAGEPVSEVTVLGWLATATGKVKWEKEGQTLPMELLRAEGERRWPGRWPGGWENFEAGAHGVRFWAPEGDARSVIVVPTGLVCYTGDKPFVSWAEVFGKSFVERMGSDLVGGAIDGIWWEPEKARYWKRYPEGKKVPLRKEDLIGHLEHQGLSQVVAKGLDFSPVEQAFWAIQQTRIVDAVAPWLYRQEDVIRENGRAWLNNSLVKLCPPICKEINGEGKPSPVAWGEGFPMIANYLESAFAEQLPWLVGWLGHFYKSCLRGDPERGWALFLAGEANSGKTFFSNAVLRLLFGGQEDVSRFLVGGDQFNEHMVAAPIWTVDDAVASTDTVARNRYSQMIKQYVANDRITCRGMHKSPITVTWKGRIVVTTNTDEESIRMIPNLDISNKDKISLMRVYSVKGKFKWPETHGGEFPLDSDLLVELPWVAGYLRDMVILPPIWEGDRFYIQPYHHPELVGMAEDASDTVASEEMLLDWRQEQFADQKDKQKLTFTPTEMYRSVSADDARRSQFRTAKSLGATLAQMVKKGVPWIRKDRNRAGRYVEILAPERD